MTWYDHRLFDLAQYLGFADEPLCLSQTVKGRICSKPDIPVEIEPYFMFLLEAIKLAKYDIENAKLGSDEFESAAEWLIHGEGYDYLTLILEEPERVKKILEETVALRRGAVEAESGSYRLVAVQRPRIRHPSTAIRSRLERDNRIPPPVE